MNTSTAVRAPWLARSRIGSPIGTLTMVATARGLAGLWFDDQAHHPGDIDAPDEPGHPVFLQAAAELAAYWADPRGARFSVPLDPQGTPFQQSVWRALLQIAPGAHQSYGAIARQLGQPQAMRAVGAAVGRNPVGIIVPCHRVLGSDGSLTGYAGGLDRKRHLLRHEGLLAATLDGFDESR